MTKTNATATMSVTIDNDKNDANDNDDNVPPMSLIAQNRTGRRGRNL